MLTVIYLYSKNESLKFIDFNFLLSLLTNLQIIENDSDFSDSSRIVSKLVYIHRMLLDELLIVLLSVDNEKLSVFIDVEIYNNLQIILLCW